LLRGTAVARRQRKAKVAGGGDWLGKKVNLVEACALGGAR
jgi:hypothetical protein